MIYTLRELISTFPDGEKKDLDFRNVEEGLAYNSYYLAVGSDTLSFIPDTPNGDIRVPIRVTDDDANYYVMNPMLAATLDTMKIDIDDDAKDWSAYQKYPYVRVLGKPLTTEEQNAFVNTCFCGCEEFNFNYDDPRRYSKFSSLHLHPPVNVKEISPVVYWAQTYKYPNIIECLEDVLFYAAAVPTADCAYFISKCEYSPVPDDVFMKSFSSDGTDNPWDSIVEYARNCDWLKDKYDFRELIDIAFLIKGGNVFVYNQKHAIELYEKYMKLYYTYWWKDIPD